MTNRRCGKCLACRLRRARGTVSARNMARALFKLEIIASRDGRTVRKWEECGGPHSLERAMPATRRAMIRWIAAHMAGRKIEGRKP